MDSAIPVPPCVHASIPSRVGVAVLRDLREEDVESLVRYWHDGGEEHLDAIGIDRARLGARADTTQRFVHAIRSGEPDQRTMAFAIAVDGRFGGYTLLNRYSADDNFSHWHITDPSLRASGLSTALYPHRLKMYFDVCPMERLIHQTRTRNVGVNRMLDRFVPIVETRYFEHPDGVAAPGEFHIRYVRRADVPRFLAMSPAPS